MTKNLRPIQLPIDPAKAHLYVARNGVRVKEIMKNTRHDNGLYPLDVIYSDNYQFKIDANGMVAYYSQCHELDLTHELIPEPEAQGLDWSCALEKLSKAAHECVRTDNRIFACDLNMFKKQALAILQEFEHECMQTSCDGCKYELDMLIEDKMDEVLSLTTIDKDNPS